MKNRENNASTNGSRKAYTNKSSLTYSRTGTRSFRSPLQRLDNNNALQHDIDGSLKRKMIIIIDDVGSRIKQDVEFDILYKPSANYTSVLEQFRNAKVPLDNAHIAIHVGTNSVLDFRRHRVITEVLALIEQIRKVTSAFIYLSSVVPRPPDHQDTAFTVRDFNHAVKKAVQVALSHGKSGIIYVSNQQLYLNQDGTIKQELFHKKQLALSKAGIACLKNNLSLKAGF